MKQDPQMQLTPTSAPPGVCLKAEGGCVQQPIKPELLQSAGPANSADLQFTEDDLAYLDDAGNAEGTPGGADLMGLGAPRRGSDDDFVGYIRGWEAADTQAAAAAAASTDTQPVPATAGAGQVKPGLSPPLAAAFKGAAALVPDSCSPMICTGLTRSARTTCTAPSGSTAASAAGACTWQQHAPSASRCSCADENSPSMGATADPAGSVAAAAAAMPAATGAAAAAAVAGSMALADFSLDEGALLAEMFGLDGADSPLGSGAAGAAPAAGGSGTAAAGGAAGSGGPTSSADADSNATMMHPQHHMVHGGHAAYGHQQHQQHQRYDGGQLPLVASPRMVINRLTAGSTGGHQQLMLGSQPGMMHSGSSTTTTHHHVVVSTHHPHHPMSQQGPAGRMPFVPGWMPAGGGGAAGAPGGQRAPSGSMMMPQQQQQQGGSGHPSYQPQPPPQHCLPGGPPPHMQQWQHAFCSCCPPASQQHGMHHHSLGSMPPGHGGMPGMMPVVRPHPPYGYMVPPPSCGPPQQPGMVVTTGGSAGLPVWANGNRTLSSIRTSMPPAAVSVAPPAPPAPAAAAPEMIDIHPAALGGFPQQALTEPPKRKRGRPRKHPLPVDAAAAAAAAPVTFVGVSAAAAAAAVAQPPKPTGLPPLGAGLPATRVPAYLQQQQAQGLASFGSWSLEPSAVKRGSLGGSSTGGAGGASSSAASVQQLQRKRSSSFTGFEDLAEPRKNSKTNLHGMQRAPSGSSGGQLTGSGSSVLLPSLASERSVDISFADLVRDAFFPPGCYAFSVGHVERAVARVTPGGDIWWGGKQYASISGFALDVVRTIYPGRQACNGWKESWLGQLQLEQWRAAYRMGQPPPVVPEACHVTGPEAEAPMGRKP